MVSSDPRIFKMRSVKTWPRSGSSANCTSSTPTKPNGWPFKEGGMLSTVQANQHAVLGTIFSSPVTKAAYFSPFSATMRS
ncbi:MAG: hypothetical protein COA47_10585 [Robiginitomaculum sp.]|nr:MAG: hypothetical protein COA47_10585 [Robiginitomaculum sp.]